MCQIKTNNQTKNQDYWLEGAYEGIWTERGANDFNNQYYKVWHNTYPAVCSSLVNLSNSVHDDFAVSRLWRIRVCLGHKIQTKKSRLHLEKESPSCSPQMWHFIRIYRWLDWQILHLFTTPWKGGCQWDEDVHGECKHGIAQLWKPQRLPVCTHCSSCWGVCSKQPGASLRLVIVVLEIRGKRNSRITHISICVQRICEN